MEDTSGFAWSLQTVVGVLVLIGALAYALMIRPRRGQARRGPAEGVSVDDRRPHYMGYAVTILGVVAAVYLFYSIGRGTLF